MDIKVRLAVMNFLEFAVWGAYLTCMGNYLGVAGLGDKISWFYAIQGIVSIFMPTLMGIVADKYIQPQRLLGLCHLLAGGFMLSCWWMGMQAGFGNELQDKSTFILLYTLSVAFFMPTIALSNTSAFCILKKNGMDTVRDFPPIRVLGTVGFIATMWFVNCAYFDDCFGFTLTDNAHKLPEWLIKGEWDMTVRYQTTSFLGDDLLGVETMMVEGRPMLVSSLERAMLEWLNMSGISNSLVDVYYVMEMLTTLRPNLLQQLLERCSSTKVKRLFMYMAEKTKYPWVEDIDKSKIDFGSGRRMISPTGKYIKQYDMTIPKELAEYE